MYTIKIRIICPSLSIKMMKRLTENGLLGFPSPVGNLEQILLKMNSYVN